MFNKKKLIGAVMLLLALALVFTATFADIGRYSRALAESSEETGEPVDGASAEDEPDGDMPASGEDPEGDDAAAPGDGSTLTTGEAPADPADPEEEEEQPKIEFVLFEKLKKVDTKGWILFAGAAVIAVGTIIYLATRKKSEKPTAEKKVSPTLILVHGALCIALSFVLSYIKLFSMPTGGSVTLASMLPLMIYANRYGTRNGLLAGLVYGILQYVQGGYFVHWLQFIFDYPLAFAFIGLGGLTKGIDKLVPSVLIGGIARFMSHFIGGAIFFGKYVMIGEGAEKGMSFFQMLPENLWASLIYNAPYMLADIAICVVIALIPPFRKAVRTALKY
ncbi:MAG: energy-coupled thiamine transporter ThiT [Clostridia bacterium]|nr:energy-coupled thiamine transporter ThiT [Clostridia bacterium]